MTSAKKSNKKYAQTLKGRASQMYNGAKRRALRKGIPFLITKGWLLHKLRVGVCEVTGIKLTLEHHDTYKCHPLSFSLDQVDPGVGYTEENCKVVSYAYNIAKNQWRPSTFKKIIRAIYIAQNGELE